ncbi:MAG: prepilin-type N-terminal cleavage/methylation domain-containing protein [Planctomycetota bacterium]
MRRIARPRHARRGFTLAEVAVTLVIVGIGMVLVLQGLNTAKIEVANTYNRKVAREMALLTLGQVQSGLFWEEGDVDRLSGNYEEESYPEFTWEIVLGDDNFQRREDSSLEFDSFRHRDELAAERERETRREDDDDDDEEDPEEPFEKVRVRVSFPRLGEWENSLEVERWIPWDQVYGVDEDQALASAASQDAR